MAAVSKNWAETFKSIQLSSLYVLYYDMDMSKVQIKHYNDFLTKHNQEELDNMFDLRAEQDKLRKVGLDTAKLAQSVPMRAKLKMMGKVKQKNIKEACRGADEAMELYFVIAFYTLRKHYSFSIAKCKEYYDALTAFVRNYADGMQDKHVFEYFKQECDLEITED